MNETDFEDIVDRLKERLKEDFSDLQPNTIAVFLPIFASFFVLILILIFLLYKLLTRRIVRQTNRSIEHQLKACAEAQKNDNGPVLGTVPNYNKARLPGEQHESGRPYLQTLHSFQQKISIQRPKVYKRSDASGSGKRMIQSDSTMVDSMGNDCSDQEKRVKVKKKIDRCNSSATDSSNSLTYTSSSSNDTSNQNLSRSTSKKSGRRSKMSLRTSMRSGRLSRKNSKLSLRKRLSIKVARLSMRIKRSGSASVKDQDLPNEDNIDQKIQEEVQRMKNKMNGVEEPPKEQSQPVQNSIDDSKTTFDKKGNPHNKIRNPAISKQQWQQFPPANWRHPML